MLSVKDQVGNTIYLKSFPKRIISIVPSQTELLYYLELNEEVVGITKFCIHPQQWFKIKKRVGGTKQLRIDAIKALKPDLIIANKEENNKEDIELLMRYYNVWISDVNNIASALQMIQQIGILVNRENQAKQLVNNIQQEIYVLEKEIKIKPSLKVAYLIWKDPYMTVGSDTFINNMMRIIGLENIFANQLRYPIVTIKAIQNSNCEYLLLSSEPYPFKNKHVEELQILCPKIKIKLVDGEMFSWYGNRLLLALPYLKNWRATLD